MKRPFFKPMLLLGLFMLIAGYFGTWMNLREARAADSDMQNFINQYQNSTDAKAIYNHALKIHKKAVFLRSEYTAFPASSVFMGIFFTIWAFDRRKLFKKFNELKKSLATTMP